MREEEEKEDEEDEYADEDKDEDGDEDRDADADAKEHPLLSKTIENSAWTHIFQIQCSFLGFVGPNSSTPSCPIRFQRAPSQRTRRCIFVKILGRLLDS